MRKICSGFAVFTLAIGPWLALLASVLGHQPSAVLASSASFGWGVTPMSAPVAPGTVDTPLGPFHVGGCTCRDITVDATNQVTNATVETGDATVRNLNITYVTAGYAQQGDAKINVDQNAAARSGDAIAGQILGVNAVGGCAHITVHARNLVTNSDVRSGDAVARNSNFVFLDPTLHRGDVKINVDQNAVAKSGNALAGQIIGVNGGGGPCGGVSIDASNEVRNVDVQTGDAVAHNLNAITQCKTDGCIREILLLLHFTDTVKVCSVNGCEDMPIRQFVRALKAQAAGTSIDAQLAALATPTPNPNNDGLVDGVDIAATPTPTPRRRPHPTPTPSASGEPTATPSDSPSPTPDGPPVAAIS